MSDCNLYYSPIIYHPNSIWPLHNILQGCYKTLSTVDNFKTCCKYLNDDRAYVLVFLQIS